MPDFITRRTSLLDRGLKVWIFAAVDRVLLAAAAAGCAPPAFA